MADEYNGGPTDGYTDLLEGCLGTLTTSMGLALAVALLALAAARWARRGETPVTR